MKITAVAREQPHPVAFALNDQAIAVVLDLVDPVFRVRHLGARRRDAGFEGGSTHGAKIGDSGWGG